MQIFLLRTKSRDREITHRRKSKEKRVKNGKTNSCSFPTTSLLFLLLSSIGCQFTSTSRFCSQEGVIVKGVVRSSKKSQEIDVYFYLANASSKLRLFCKFQGGKEVKYPPLSGKLRLIRERMTPPTPVCMYGSGWAFGADNHFSTMPK